MSSMPDDRKAAALIRDVAMALVAERGASDVTIREIASAAGVSPGLVMHHFGSKERLKGVLDARALAFLDEMVAELAALRDDGGSASLAEVVAERLEREPALAAYIARLLIDDPAAGDRLFGTLLDTTVTVLDAFTDAGFAREAPDPRTRAAFLLANDLAVILLRSRLAAAVGFDPLSRAGVGRWSATVMDVYTHGVLAAPDGGPAPRGSGR